ncbi:MAG TPA: MMPL family transporter [Thermoleophilaceae bacterium]
MKQPNIAARMGRWSARHWKTAVIGWIVFVVVSVALGSAIGTKKLTDAQSGTGSSGRADRLLDREFKRPDSEQVLIQSRKVTLHDPAFRAAVNDVTTRFSHDGVVKDVRSPLAPGNAGQVSKDGHSALVTFDIKGDADKADDKADGLLAVTAAAQKAHPSLLIQEAGDATADKALNDSFSNDFNRARTLSLPITLAILIFAFGALVAAGIPVLLAITGVAATLGLVALPSHIAPVDDAVSEVVLLVGMAVGVDYSLFYLRREREERAKGASPEQALESAAATSGHSVIVSGLTVIAAMAGMYLAGDKTFGSMATGTIMVVAVSVLGSVTVLPALLSRLGDKVMLGRVPFIGRRRDRGENPRVSGWIMDRVLRRPVVSMVLSGGLLLALAVPAFSLHTAVPGLQGLPHNLPIVRTLDRVQTAFPGGPTPAQVVVSGRNVDTPQVHRAIASLKREGLASGQIKQPMTVDVNRAHTVAVVSMPLVGQGTDDVSVHALETLRTDLVPRTVGAVPGAHVDVTGETAGSKDFNDSMKSHAPLVFAFVLTMAFLLLLVTFRSIVIPLKAIVLNLLSVGAAYGVLELVFQHTWAEGLLGFKSTGGITSWLPLFLFVILFGLSMDYHVFIISRIREAFDGGMKTEDAVAHGIKSTAGVVTSAAFVMVAVFAIFASLGALEFKQLGVGLAAAILIDATIVRAVLLPATMKLLGDWNWYLPRGLRWLPSRRASRPSAEPARA